MSNTDRVLCEREAMVLLVAWLLVWPAVLGITHPMIPEMFLNLTGLQTDQLTVFGTTLGFALGGFMAIFVYYIARGGELPGEKNGAR